MLHHPFRGVMWVFLAWGTFKKCKNFDPFVFFPDGEGEKCMLDPSYVKNRGPEDLHLGGLKALRTPP
jgi:hypothetical protein